MKLWYSVDQDELFEAWARWYDGIDELGMYTNVLGRGRCYLVGDMQ